ncbi:LexA family protein [Vreelandella malpeensis]|uniref:Translesion error-prone DNA polymerase V autoproteolytic subunit n=1 Tax=Vreelandella malpeensis TaxID=1172368 RepID=A0ABS8DUA5_9GAMM|nr:translesion error-prone DNA polymerase V autoproteolytic subunit [Halomonas malpeensis]MCB8889912.1 translesion error-prone DNA polymerase V autoproteolytic subunit [Halomonas malpeensis]
MSMHLTNLGRVDQFAPALSIPLVAGFVRTGFPSPADDYLEGELDLVDHLIQHPSATYFLRAKGTSMEGVGIYDGDLLIVDRSVEPRPGHIVIMSVDGELTCKKLSTIGNRPYLVAANPEFRPIPLFGRECQVWGVVTHNIHSLAPGFSV